MASPEAEETVEMSTIRRHPSGVALETENTSIESAQEPIVVPDKDDVEYPDGGIRAYSVITGSFLGCITCLGLINSIGAIQAYVSTHQLQNLSATSISWIFSIYLSLAYALGIVVGPIFDYKGARAILAVATALVFAGLMGAANSTKVYQFILSFICMGLGNGIGLTPLVGVINHWFFRKRGLMTGVVTSGGSMGGLVFPLLLRHTFVKYGYVWAMRILAFVNGACMLSALVLVQERVRREKVKDVNPDSAVVSMGDGTFNINIKKIASRFLNVIKKHAEKSFALTVAGAFCTELALVLALTYFVTYAVAQGMSESTGYLLLTTWNATSILGRILPGLTADYAGKFNVNIVMITGLAISTFTLWYAFGSSIKPLYAFAGVGGFFSGSILGLTPACLAQITKVSEFGERYGILNFFLSFGNLVGIPIGATVIGDGSAEHYDNFVILVGCLCVAGTVSLTLARTSLVGLRLNTKV